MNKYLTTDNISQLFCLTQKHIDEAEDRTAEQVTANSLVTIPHIPLQ